MPEPDMILPTSWRLSHPEYDGSCSKGNRSNAKTSDTGSEYFGDPSQPNPKLWHILDSGLSNRGPYGSEAIPLLFIILYPRLGARCPARPGLPPGAPGRPHTPNLPGQVGVPSRLLGPTSPARPVFPPGAPGRPHMQTLPWQVRFARPLPITADNVATPSRSKPHRINSVRSQNSQNARCIPTESRRLRVSSCKSMRMILNCLPNHYGITDF